jgi:hypothetical protein
MRRRVFNLGCLGLLGLLSACLGATAIGYAQEGHPLTGTWTGDWGPSPSQRTHLTIVLNFDGSTVSGIINPGPDSITIPGVTVDVTKWTVHFEADAKGQPVVADGQIEDLASPHRRITGTWRQGTTKGDFRITRD